jgi:hypothetical protein
MFVPVGIQHAMRVHQIVIYGLPTLKYFSTLSHKQHYFGKRAVEHKISVLNFSANFILTNFLF